MILSLRRHSHIFGNVVIFMMTLQAIQILYVDLLFETES